MQTQAECIVIQITQRKLKRNLKCKIKHKLKRILKHKRNRKLKLKLKYKLKRNTLSFKIWFEASSISKDVLILTSIRKVKPC